MEIWTFLLLSGIYLSLKDLPGVMIKVQQCSPTSFTVSDHKLFFLPGFLNSWSASCLSQLPFPITYWFLFSLTDSICFLPTTSYLLDFILRVGFLTHWREKRWQTFISKASLKSSIYSRNTEKKVYQGLMSMAEKRNWQPEGRIKRLQ